MKRIYQEHYDNAEALIEKFKEDNSLEKSFALDMMAKKAGVNASKANEFLSFDLKKLPPHEKLPTPNIFLFKQALRQFRKQLVLHQNDHKSIEFSIKLTKLINDITPYVAYCSLVEESLIHYHQTAAGAWTNQAKQMFDNITMWRIDKDHTNILEFTVFLQAQLLASPTNAKILEGLIRAQDTMPNYISYYSHVEQVLSSQLYDKGILNLHRQLIIWRTKQGENNVLDFKAFVQQQCTLYIPNSRRLKTTIENLLAEIPSLAYMKARADGNASGKNGAFDIYCKQLIELLTDAAKSDPEWAYKINMVLQLLKTEKEKAEKQWQEKSIPLEKGKEAKSNLWTVKEAVLEAADSLLVPKLSLLYSNAAVLAQLKVILVDIPSRRYEKLSDRLPALPIVALESSQPMSVPLNSTILTPTSSSASVLLPQSWPPMPLSMTRLDQTSGSVDGAEETTRLAALSFTGHKSITPMLAQQQEREKIGSPVSSPSSPLAAMNVDQEYPERQKLVT